MIKRQIIAIGGDTGVSHANQTGKRNPKICFMATASGDSFAVYEAYKLVQKGKIEEVVLENGKI